MLKNLVIYQHKGSVKNKAEQRVRLWNLQLIFNYIGSMNHLQQQVNSLQCVLFPIDSNCSPKSNFIQFICNSYCNITFNRLEDVKGIEFTLSQKLEARRKVSSR